MEPVQILADELYEPSDTTLCEPEIKRQLRYHMAAAKARSAIAALEAKGYVIGGKETRPVCSHNGGCQRPELCLFVCVARTTSNVR